VLGKVKGFVVLKLISIGVPPSLLIVVVVVVDGVGGGCPPPSSRRLARRGGREAVAGALGAVCLLLRLPRASPSLQLPLSSSL